MSLILRLQRWLRWYFVGAAAGSAGLVLIVAASGFHQWQNGGIDALEPTEWFEMASRGVAFAIVAYVSGMAFWTGQEERETAPRWEVAASLANLMFLFPVGTLPGFVGLLVFHHGKKRMLLEGESQPHFEPRVGDGTWRYSLETFLLLKLGLTGGGLIWLDMVCRRAGIRYGVDIMPQGAAVLLAIVLSVLAHETGHVVAAWIGGFSVRGLSVGLFSWIRIYGRSIFRIGRSTMLGGFTHVMPTKEGGLRNRYLLFVAGGPAGSLLLGLVCLVGLATAVGRPWISIWRLLEILAAFCLADVVCNLVPTAVGAGGYSDGALLWQMYSGGLWARHRMFQLYRQLSTTTMLSPAEWPSDQVEESVTFAALPAEKVKERVFALCHYRLKGDLAGAAIHWDGVSVLIENTSDPAIEVYASEFAFYGAFHAGCAVKARGWLTRIRKDLIDDHDRAAAAVLGVEGDMVGAREAWERGWRLVERSPANGNRKLDVMDFADMAERWFPDLVGKVATGVQAPDRSQPGRPLK